MDNVILPLKYKLQSFLPIFAIFDHLNICFAEELNSCPSSLSYNCFIGYVY